jgi:hypothetical protein
VQVRAGAETVVPTLLHFSEDPDIKLFRPHVAKTAAEQEPFVWAVDEEHAPAYWFPRQCPRACCWRPKGEDASHPHALLGVGSIRLHAVEWSWLERIRACRLFCYRFDAASFRSHLEEAGYWTSAEAVAPLSVSPVGDLLERHAAAGIELRLVSNLWPVIDAIVESGLPFSIIRHTNARGREGGARS